MPSDRSYDSNSSTALGTRCPYPKPVLPTPVGEHPNMFAQIPVTPFAKSFRALVGNLVSSTDSKSVFLPTTFLMNRSRGVMLVLLLLQASEASTRFQTLSSATNLHGIT